MFTTGVLVPNLPVIITSSIDVIDKFVMDAKCSFSAGVAKIYYSGDFRGSPFAVQRLLECKDDVTGHLQSCHLSK